jgi:hypothetical protein
MFDLALNDPSKQADVGYEFQVVMPDGSTTDAFITVRGENSNTVKNFRRRKQQEQKLKADQAARRGKKVEELTPEEEEELFAEIAANRVISWKGLTENGKELVFSKEEAERLFMSYPFLIPQVLEASNNIFNFSKS